MPLDLTNVSITIPNEVVAQLKQVFLPTMQEQAMLDAPLPTFSPDLAEHVAKQIIDNHGDPLVNSIIDTGGDSFAAKVAEQVELDMQDVAERIDMSALAQEIDTGEIAREIDMSDLADHLANKFDAAEIAEHFSDREIAREIDCSDVASELDARRVADCLSVSEIASELDLEEVARHVEVNDEVVAREFAKWLSTNPDGMSHFVHAFCKAYVEATSVASR
jgi:hypothetical protein